MRNICAIVISVLLVSSCASAAKSSGVGFPLLSVGTWSPLLKEYRQFYGWDDDWGSWGFKLIPGGAGDTIAAHVFSSHAKDAEYRGTLFMVHGYLEHGSLRAPIAAHALAEGWLPVAIDLPGHGLSSGERGGIDSFDQYRAALEAVLESADWPRPWRIMGHSLGCATIMLYIQEHGNPFEFTILEAPLVRTFQWELSMTGIDLMKNRLETLPRLMGDLPLSQPYARLLSADPLYPRTMPFSWIFALEQFVQDVQDWEPVGGRVLILQGQRDMVVDGKYNVPFLAEKLLEEEVAIIPGGRHIMLRYIGRSGDIARQILHDRWSSVAP